MGTPSVQNGIERAFKEIALPSAFILLSVIFANNTWGKIVAGVVFLLLTAGMLLLIYQSAKYWTTTYTAGFAFTGIIFLFTVPDIISPLIHPVFDYLGTILVFIFLIFMVKMFAVKWGIMN